MVPVAVINIGGGQEMPCAVASLLGEDMFGSSRSSELYGNRCS